jgi:two-component system, NtrC family, sensor histidine kinase HydH
MNRKLLLRITLPSALFGLVLFAACLLSIRYIHRLQTNLADILAENVARLQTVQELEIQVRQLRFHSFLYMLDPRPDRLTRVVEDEKAFETAFEATRQIATEDQEQALLKEIDSTYQHYKGEQERLIVESDGRPIPDVYKIADRHPVRLVVVPCQELLRINREKMVESSEQSQRVSREAYLAMLFLGIAGPIGGLALGFGLTRGLHRSIYRLSVRVQDLAQHLDHDIGSVSVVGDQDLDTLEADLRGIVARVEEVAAQIQEQQRALLRAEQLSQAGLFATGVAHEIRNPLTGIKLLAEAALRPQAPRPLTLEDTQFILRETRKLEDTVEHFLDFARAPKAKIAPCDLRGVVTESWSSVKTRAAQQNVHVAMNLSPSPSRVSADAERLRSVLVNLFLNALDAMPSGGRITIDLSKCGAEFLELRISDTGPGIGPEILEKLFQPFATSKPKGTGLGLFLTSQILDEHGGSIRANNRPEGGASFTIRLPVLAPGDSTP